MTLELKQYPNSINGQYQKPYLLGGVQEITNNTEYGQGCFAIAIFDRRVFATECFEFVRDKDTGRYFVKDGKWVQQLAEEDNNA